ncbi:MAG: DUF4159 domain-containing protein [Anaerolineaceae bacterium]|nr:DUF4159 domain-containing protein [Anaerolineaceae bacterium]
MPKHCRCVAIIFLAATALGVVPGAVQGQGLKLKFVTTNKDVDEATKRLRDFLWVRQLDDGSWTDVTGAHYQRRVGWTTALVSLAMLESGVKLNRPEMEKALEALMAAEMKDSISRATRAMALCVAYRAAKRREWEVQIVKDLEWLTQKLPQNGAWGYKGADRDGNNMASQFGLLALWEAELAGFDGKRKFSRTAADKKDKKSKKDRQDKKDGQEAFNPARAWPMVLRNLKRAWPQIERQWVRRQRADHGWTFSAVAGPDVQSTMVMTAAGVSSLYIVLDKVYAPKMFPGKPRPKTKVFDGIDTGMAWLASRLKPGFAKDGYLSFGIQRIAAAGGHKYIGQHDWFRLGVRELMDITTNCRANCKGPYGPDVEAAMYLLFLSRGRVPITFNKLQRPGTDWDCAPRDVANLTRFLNRELEQRMNWQIVDVNRPVAEFLDAPVLLINGIKPLAMKDEIIRKIREYVNRGGFVLGEATTSSRAFAESFKKMMVKAFPEGTEQGAKYYRWHEVPREHPLLDTMTDRDLRKLGTIWAMDSPIRTVAVLLPRDQATAWQQMDVAKNRHSFTMGRNILLYATAGEQLKTRLRPVYAGRTITAKTARKVAALSTTGRWLGEPYVIERLSDKLARDAMIMVEAAPAHAPGELDPRETPMIWVYGHGTIGLGEGRIQSLRRYVQKGGLVAFSANKGDKVFAKAAEALALKILPDALPAALGPTDPIMTGLVYRERGKPLTNPKFRAMRLARDRKVRLTGYRQDGRIGVIVSPYDVFLGILGTPIYGDKDYTGETARQIAANIYLYALEQAEQGAEGTKR